MSLSRGGQVASRSVTSFLHGTSQPLTEVTPEVQRPASRRVASGTRLYHLTSKVDFRLDPKKKPRLNTTMGGDLKPGIFLTDNPEHWTNGYGYWQPWLVEFEVPSDLEHLDGVIKGGYGAEVYVPATHYDRLRIVRVMPLDGYAREKYYDWGWTEEEFGTDFETGEPLPKTGQRGKYRTDAPPAGYRAPDARQWAKDKQDAYKARMVKFRRQRGKGAYASLATTSLRGVGSGHDAARAGDEPRGGAARGGGARRVAGPASGRVRRERVLTGVSGRDARRSRPVEIEGISRGEFARLDKAWQKLVGAALKDLQDGRAKPEQKERPPLTDCFSLRVGPDRSGFRVVFFIGIDGKYHVFYLGFHDYHQAEQRMGAAGLTWRTYDEGTFTYVEAHQGTQRVGYLGWHRDNGEIMHVQVNPRHRRQGIATELLRRAREIDPRVHHSTSLSQDGAGWASRVGGKNGDLPDLVFNHTRAGDTHSLTASDPTGNAFGGPLRAGVLYWSASTGEIKEVEVALSYRRRGVASAMLAHARTIQPNVHHSDMLSQDGAGWASRVGGKNGDLPAGLTFERVEGKRWRAIDAWLSGSIVGSINWATTDLEGEPGEIMDVTIVASMQRRGIGTALLAQAREWDDRVHHSTNLTGAGRAWSQHVGAAGRMVPVATVLTWLSADATNEDRSANLPVSTLIDAKRQRPGYQALLEDIRANGIRDPLLRDPKNGLLYDGHTRLAAAIELGMTHVPVQTRKFTGSKTALKSLTWEYEVEWSARNPEGVHPHLTLGARTFVVEVDADSPTEAQLLAHSMVDSGLITRRDPLPDGMVTRLTLLSVRPTGSPHISKQAAFEEKTVTLKDGTQIVLIRQPPGSYSSRAIGAYRDTAHGRVEAGYLLWEAANPPGWEGRPPMIADVGVQKPFQRKGLATAMLAFAREFEPDLTHSHSLSPDGRAWAEKVAAKKRYAVEPFSEGFLVRDTATGTSQGAFPTRNKASQYAREMNDEHEDRLAHPEEYREAVKTAMPWGDQPAIPSTKYQEGYVLRGLTFSASEALAKKIVAHEVGTGPLSARDLLTEVGSLGIWWWAGKGTSIEDPMIYAEGMGDPNYTVKGLAEQDDFDGGEVCMVVVAKSPQRNGVDWDPEIHNEANGLMGNSHLEPGEPLEIVEIMYDAGWGWKALPGQGLRTTAAAPMKYDVPDSHDGPLYRGVGFVADKADAAYLFDASVPVHRRAEKAVALFEVYRGKGGLGRHWSTERTLARHFGLMSGTSLISEAQMEDREAVGLLITINPPEPSTFERDERVLTDHGVGGGEKEITLRPGTRVGLIGAEWWSPTDSKRSGRIDGSGPGIPKVSSEGTDRNMPAKDCVCCGGTGEHDTGAECIACDASGTYDGGPIPCVGTLPDKTASLGGTIYRGLRVPLTDEIRHLFREYLEPEEVAERRTDKVGPMILDFMEGHGSRLSPRGLGIHWSTRIEMAAVAAETQAQGGDLPVIIEATYTPADVVPDGDPLYDLGGVWKGNKIEAEVTIKPDARLTITGVWVFSGIGNSQVVSVDDCPTRNVRGDTYANMLPRPQQRRASKTAAPEGVPHVHWDSPGARPLPRQRQVFHVVNGHLADQVKAEGLRAGWDGAIHVWTSIEDATRYTHAYADPHIFLVWAPAGTMYEPGVNGEQCHLVLLTPGPLRVAEVPRFMWKDGAKTAALPTDPGLSVEAGVSALGPLPISKGRVWYRVQYSARAWNHGPGPHSTSAPFAWDSMRDEPIIQEYGRQNGYSAFDNPRDLKRYMDQRWNPATLRDAHKHKVVIFTGTQIGHGHDDEPLVQPDGKRSSRVEMSWQEFTDRLRDTPERTRLLDVYERARANEDEIQTGRAGQYPLTEMEKQRLHLRELQRLLDADPARFLEQMGRAAALRRQAGADTESGVMVALIPPLEVCKALVAHEMATEDLAIQHITLIYLGKTADVNEADLHEAVARWAEGAPPISGKVSGYGTFLNEQGGVLYASWDVPGATGWREGLLAALRAKDIDTEENHGWTPHQTLAYTDAPITTLPPMPDGLPEEVIFGSVAVAYGGDWTSHSLTGDPA